MPAASHHAGYLVTESTLSLLLSQDKLHSSGGQKSHSLKLWHLSWCALWMPSCIITQSLQGEFAAKWFLHENGVATTHSSSYHSAKHWVQTGCEQAFGNLGTSMLSLWFISLLWPQELGLLVGQSACRWTEPSADESCISFKKGLPREDEAASRLFRGLEQKESCLDTIIWSWGIDIW